MKPLAFDNVPLALRELTQWILWRSETRGDKPTKIPYCTDGKNAKSNDRTTWDSFENAREVAWQYSGIGFVFSADDPFIGIDLDGCRDSHTGKIAEWAREVILKFNAYAEVSPSETGVKIFCRGKLPFANGRKVEVKQEPICDKTPAVEMYDRGRYFAVTGWVLKGQLQVAECQAAIDWFKEKFFPNEPAKPIPDFRSNDAVVERARKYLAKMPPAVSGQSGHNATFHAACVLALGFELSESDAISLMLEFNQRCQPPWSDKDINRKVREALKQSGARGYLRNAAPAHWDRVQVPTYSEPKAKPELTQTTIADAADQYITMVERGQISLVETSIADLDCALCGGLGFGEMVIFAGRPSHGKSAVALQCLHHWTDMQVHGYPCCIVSEEMSSLMLGKRTVQHLVSLPEEHWRTQSDRLRDEMQCYRESHAPCFIIENSRTAEAAASAIEKRVESDGVRCAVIDYAQLLQSPGKSRYEQITNTSIALRQLASRCNIVLLVLCHLNREIEKRSTFTPSIADIKDTGQLEQDADVVSFLVWPHRINKDKPRGEYQFFIYKNRNRGTNGDNLVTCHFDPMRQSFRDAFPKEFADREEKIPL